MFEEDAFFFHLLFKPVISFSSVKDGKFNRNLGVGTSSFPASWRRCICKGGGLVAGGGRRLAKYDDNSDSLSMLYLLSCTGLRKDGN